MLFINIYMIIIINKECIIFYCSLGSSRSVAVCRIVYNVYGELMR